MALVSDHLVGGYKVHSDSTLPPNNYSYTDEGMIHDPVSGNWYLLTSADHNNLQVNILNPDGSVGKRMSNIRKHRNF